MTPFQNIPCGVAESIRGRSKSLARLKVEHALRQAATQGLGLTRNELANRTGVDNEVVGGVLKNMMNNRTVQREGCNPGKYSLGGASAPAAAQVAAAGPFAFPTRPAPTSGRYDGTELHPYTGRPNAMDAFTLPSLVNGQRRPRVAPRLIAAQPEKFQ